jgi:hypothetical protein
VRINRAPNDASGYKILQQPESSKLALDEISARNDIVLLLSALSNVSLLSISVSGRTREIGLRAALDKRQTARAPFHPDTPMTKAPTPMGVRSRSLMTTAFFANSLLYQRAVGQGEADGD